MKWTIVCLDGVHAKHCHWRHACTCWHLSIIVLQSPKATTSSRQYRKSLLVTLSSAEGLISDCATWAGLQLSAASCQRAHMCTQHAMSCWDCKRSCTEGVPVGQDMLQLQSLCLISVQNVSGTFLPMVYECCNEWKAVIPVLCFADCARTLATWCLIWYKYTFLQHAHSKACLYCLVIVPGQKQQESGVQCVDPADCYIRACRQLQSHNTKLFSVPTICHWHASKVHVSAAVHLNPRDVMLVLLTS